MLKIKTASTSSTVESPKLTNAGVSIYPVKKTIARKRIMLYGRIPFDSGTTTAKSDIKDKLENVKKSIFVVKYKKSGSILLL